MDSLTYRLMSSFFSGFLPIAGLPLFASILAVSLYFILVIMRIIRKSKPLSYDIVITLCSFSQSKEAGALGSLASSRLINCAPTQPASSFHPPPQQYQDQRLSHDDSKMIIL